MKESTPLRIVVKQPNQFQEPLEPLFAHVENPETDLSTQKEIQPKMLHAGLGLRPQPGTSKAHLVTNARIATTERAETIRTRVTSSEFQKEDTSWRDLLRFANRTTQLHEPLQPVLRPAQKTSKVSRWSVFGGWVLDAFLGASLFAVAGIVSFTTTINGSKKWMMQFVTSSFKHPLVREYGGEIAMLAHSFALGSLFLFVVQFFCTLIVASTFGRYIFDARLQGLSWKSRLPAAFFVAVGEALTVGGVLALPLILIFPRRVPLFPWKKLG